VFPVRVRPRDGRQPVRLAASIDYGVCKDICIPAHAELSLTLPDATEPAHAALVETALARVPHEEALGRGGDLAILAVAPIEAGGKPALGVTVRVPEGVAPQLFVEAPDNWFLAAASAMSPAEGQPPGTGRFVVAIEDRPKHVAGALPLRFTLVAGARAIETTASLDAAHLSR
jgi:DsbC/DsbD-like thiol-disulfide interchange protein